MLVPAAYRPTKDVDQCPRWKSESKGGSPRHQLTRARPAVPAAPQCKKRSRRRTLTRSWASPPHSRFRTAARLHQSCSQHAAPPALAGKVRTGGFWPHAVRLCGVWVGARLCRLRSSRTRSRRACRGRRVGREGGTGGRRAGRVRVRDRWLGWDGSGTRRDL